MPALIKHALTLGHLLCVSSFQDNYGFPDHQAKLHEKTIDEVTSGCQFDFQAMSSVLEDATMNFYPSTEEWAKWHATDLVPENEHLYIGLLKGARKFKKGKATILAADCEVQNEDGSVWSIQRLGPFKSTGNYDWWQFAWTDVLRFKEKLKLTPEGLYVLSHFSGPVDAQGKVLDFPPIHIHHVHLSPGDKAIYRVDSFPGCLYDKSMCSHAFHVMAEQHGDYVCMPQDGGTDCYIEELASGYGKTIHRPMTINGEVNDVRAPNSPEIEWYYQVAAKWVPISHPIGKQLAPLSVHAMWGPGRFNTNDQSTMVATFLTPTAYENVYWYTGYMFASGKLVRGKLHSHNTVFEEAYLFSAAPDQLGFGSSKFKPKSKAFEVLRTSELGFESNQELKQYMMEHLNTSMQSEHANKKPRLVCQGKASSLYVDGYDFDRRDPTHCDEWHFKKGEQFTVIAFNRQRELPAGPHMPDQVPAYIPGHVAWGIFSELEGTSESKYTFGFYSHDPGFSLGHTNGEVAFGGLINMFVVMANGGMPSRIQFWNIIHIFAICIGLMLCVILFGVRYVLRKAKKLN